VDLNRDGRIGTGFELFSNIAKQPGMPKGANGFKALARYDLPANGGNGDGINRPAGQDLFPIAPLGG
jgi:hypothetical protein